VVNYVLLGGGLDSGQRRSAQSIARKPTVEIANAAIPTGQKIHGRLIAKGSSETMVSQPPTPTASPTDLQTFFVRELAGLISSMRAL
jgi:hypothetical protein